MAKKKQTEGETPQKIDEKLRKQIMKEEKEKLTKQAEKIALKKVTEIQLATQAPISEQQKDAVKLLGNGFSQEETAEKLGIECKAIEAWMQQSNFTMALNENTIKQGSSDRNERIRQAKRIVQSINDTIAEKITNDELKNLNMSTLNKMLLDWSNRLDTLVDQKQDVGKQDLTVLILNHVQKNNAKNYDKVEDFLNDKEFSYPTLDVVDAEYTEVKDE